MSKKTKKEEAEHCYKTGEDYGNKGDADEAIIWWKKTIEHDPEHFLAWYNLGNVYFWGKEDLENAFEHWEKALELKPDDIDLNYNMGNAYKELKQNDKAIECYKRLVKKAP
ncbi:MAG: tetratricopeptide repeat protein, partial [Candidatus Heimdallarchaeota archaeon]